MSRWTAIAKMIDEQDKHEGRKSPRFVARNMCCEGSGKVQDFSATGVRVIYSKRPKFVGGDVIDLRIESERGTHCGEAEVVWSKKIGFRKFEVGFRFTDPEAVKKMRLFQSGFDVLEDNHWSAA